MRRDIVFWVVFIVALTATSAAMHHVRLFPSGIWWEFLTSIGFILAYIAGLLSGEKESKA